MRDEEAMAIVEQRAITKVIAMRDRIESLESQLREAEEEIEDFGKIMNVQSKQLRSADELATEVKNISVSVNGQTSIGKWVREHCETALAAYEKARGR